MPFNYEGFNDDFNVNRLETDDFSPEKVMNNDDSYLREYKTGNSELSMS